MRLIQTANADAEKHVTSRVYSIVFLLLTFAVALPPAMNAQQAARIRATARVVRSVLPETQAVTASRLESLTQIDLDPDAVTSSPVMSSRGFVHVSTEPLLDERAHPNGQLSRERDLSRNRHPEVLQITVAYTAN